MAVAAGGGDGARRHRRGEKQQGRSGCARGERVQRTHETPPKSANTPADSDSIFGALFDKLRVPVVPEQLPVRMSVLFAPGSKVQPPHETDHASAVGMLASTSTYRALVVASPPSLQGLETCLFGWAA